MVEQPLVIAQLEPTVTEWIEQEAQRTGKPVEEVARQLIYQGLEVERNKAQQERHHDLDGLAGTWSTEEAAEFRHAIADLDLVDPVVWQ